MDTRKNTTNPLTPVPAHNRAVELAQKLALPGNAHIRKYVPIWVEESKAYADMMMERYGRTEAQACWEGYRVLFIMNHLCPDLYHFHRCPDPRVFRGDIDGFNRAYEKHMRENTQVGIIGKNGVCIQEGVTYTKETFEALMDALLPYMGGNTDV